MSAPAAPAPRPDEALRAQTLQTLLQRIRAEPDFPTLRESMLSVQRIAQSDPRYRLRQGIQRACAHPNHPAGGNGHPQRSRL